MKTRNKNNLVVILELTNIKSVMKKLLDDLKFFYWGVFGEERASELEDRLIDI